MRTNVAVIRECTDRGPARDGKTVGVAALLSELRSLGIRVWLDGGQLRCDAPAGVMTADLRDALRQRKAEITEFLQAADALSRQQRAIVPLQPRGERDPVFAVGGHNGDVFCYRALAAHLGEDQPFFGLQPPGLDGHSAPLAQVADLAAYFAAQIRGFGPRGPAVIAGYCAGGAIAFELARQLLRDGTPVRCVALFGGPYPSWYRLVPQIRHRVAQQWERLGKHGRALAALTDGRRQYITDRLRRRTAGRDAGDVTTPDPVVRLRATVEAITLTAVRQYTPEYLPSRLCLILPNKKWMRSRDSLLSRRWHPLANEIDQYCGSDDCNGDSMLLEPHVTQTAELFQRSLDQKTSVPC
jgi:thioesterase domain-containing protein